MTTGTVSTLVSLLFHWESSIFILSPLMICITSVSLFTDISITQALLSLAVTVKVALNRMRDLVDVPCFPALFERLGASDDEVT